MSLRRRDLIRWSCSTAAGLAAARCLPGFALAEDVDNRPNLLVILADDLGINELSSHGADDLETPNLDRLAAEGMSFDNFYASSPVCSPTRAALLTGRFPELVGVPGVIRARADISYGNLHREAKLLPLLLRERASYHTALVGQWHLGLAKPNLPNLRGFEHFQGFLGDMMDDYYHHRRNDRNLMRLNGDPIDPAGHATDLFAEWACTYLKRRRADEKFFLLLAFNAPHEPIQPPPEWLEQARVRHPETRDPKRLKLVALIEHLDSAIGKVLQALEAQGLAENTLVVFTSDNGGSLAHGADNGPYRGGKGSLYEGGLRVPTLARWPARIDPGSRSSLVATTMDLTPTLLQAAGITERPKAMDGRSFLPTLLGREQPWPERDLFFGRRDADLKGAAIHAMRRGSWKLVRSRPGAPYELYDLVEDAWETEDVAAKESRRAAVMAAALEAHVKRSARVPWRPGGAT